jgi:hypothetical protein
MPLFTTALGLYGGVLAVGRAVSSKDPFYMKQSLLRAQSSGLSA